ncbi:MAG: acetyl-CoA carboxylase biotin carboxyl carrier protein [Clostridiales bacterium]|mgnify:CR=1 FL=1|jgi:acetyl-CoA carboxylase biotin carboxyl carrier protein|nr:acetyl-CoA carboxylase biotin carboxyl carrier protein [Clostridiales bacterium]
MDIGKIRQLADIIKQNNLESIEVKTDDIEIKIKANTHGHAAQPATRQVIADAAEGTIPDKIKGGAHVVASPMVGVYYAAPAPDKEPFVRVGDRVSKGDVLCIIEAMKLMNEITSDRDGEIVEICVENGQIVEYDQPLFRII